MTTTCRDLMDIDEEGAYLVCDLPADHTGDHHATGTEPTHPQRRYVVTWEQRPAVVPGEVIA